MSYIPEDKIEDIKSQADIVSMISSYVELKQRGKNFIGLCPFHHEKTPSFTVSPQKQIFHCFGCGEGGDVISFIMKKEGLTYIEAIRFIADKLGIFLETGKIDRKKYDHYKKLIRINEQAKLFFYKNLLVKDVPKDYIASRGLDRQLINRFMIGYADHSNSLLNYFKKNGVATDDLLELGLVSRSKNGTLYDKFRDRLIFPIFNTRNNCIGFGGRTLVGHDAKYMNSPQSIVYDKSKNIYGIDHLKNARKTGYVILVEGYMDVIALAGFGIDSAIASLGTSLTLDQAKLISRYHKKVYICYDGDSAGIQATIRACDIFKEIHIKPEIIQIPDGKDPDEYIHQFGKESFEYLIQNAKDPIMFQYSILKDQYDLNDLSQRLEFINHMTNLLMTVDREILRVEYCKRFAGDLEMDYHILINDVNKKLKQDHSTPQDVVKPEKGKNDEQKKLAFELMKQMAFNADQTERFSKFYPYFLEIDEFNRYYQYVKKRDGKAFTKEEIMKEHNFDDKFLKVLDALYQTKHKQLYRDNEFLDVLYQSLEKYQLQQRKNELKKELELLRDNVLLDQEMKEKYKKLLNEIMDLTKKTKI